MNTEYIEAFKKTANHQTVMFTYHFNTIIDVSNDAIRDLRLMGVSDIKLLRAIIIPALYFTQTERCNLNTKNNSYILTTKDIKEKIIFILGEFGIPECFYDTFVKFAHKLNFDSLVYSYSLPTIDLTYLEYDASKSPLVNFVVSVMEYLDDDTTTAIYNQIKQKALLQPT